MQASPAYVATCLSGAGMVVNEANARRIVACVNACAGLSTEALEAGMLGNLISHTRNGAQGSADLALAKLEGK